MLRRNFATLQDSLEANPDSARSLITAVDNVAQILDRQNAEVSRSLALADEYLTALEENSDVVIKLVNKLNLLETIVHNDKAASAG